MATKRVDRNKQQNKKEGKSWMFSQTSRNDTIKRARLKSFDSSIRLCFIDTLLWLVIFSCLVNQKLCTVHTKYQRYQYKKKKGLRKPVSKLYGQFFSLKRFITKYLWREVVLSRHKTENVLTLLMDK